MSSKDSFLKNQCPRGFAPILVLMLLAIIGASSLLIIKNIPFEDFKKSATAQSESTISAQVKSSQGPAFRDLSRASSPISPIMPSAAPAKTSTSSNSSVSNSTQSSASNNSSSAANSTPTPSSTVIATAAPTPTPTPTPVPVTTSSTNNGITVALSCSGNTLHAYVTGDIPSPGDRNVGLWSTLVESNTGKRMIYEYNGNQGSTTHIAANFPPTGAITAGDSFSVVGDGRTYQVKIYAAPSPAVSGMPNLNHLVAETSFSKTCP